MNGAKLFQGFLAVLALLTFAELLFSNLNTLLTNLEPAAEQIGLSVGMERIRLVILIVFDAIAGVGALYALSSFRQRDAASFSQGLLVTLVGFLGYAIYQIASAWIQLAPAYRTTVTGFAVVYALLGLGAYFGGRRVWRSVEEPSSVRGNY
jgi:hypothetical protein